MKEINISRGKKVFVDDEDFNILSQHKWNACCDGISKNFYARRTARVPGGGWMAISMHRFILGNKCIGFVVDHKDGNTLNNQKINLRICTRSQNGANRKIQKNNTSGYPGVSKSRNKWQANIMVNKKSKHLGVFETPEMAYNAYKLECKKAFGEFFKEL
jgi:hypothetical protein